jgi:hypothetical protein
LIHTGQKGPPITGKTTEPPHTSQIWPPGKSNHCTINFPSTHSHFVQGGESQEQQEEAEAARLTMDDGSSDELVDSLLQIKRDQSTSYARKIHTFFLLLFSMGHLAHKQTHNNLQNLAAHGW